MSISLGEFLLALLRHVAMAVGFAALALLGIEWLLPGSVLPFIDLVNYLPYTTSALVAALVMSRYVKSIRGNLLTVVGVLTGCGLLAILAALQSGHRIGAAVLVAAGFACLAAWAVGAKHDQR